MTSGGERFPLDFDQLSRGDYLPAEVVEKAILAERSDPNYRIKVLGLRDQIRRHFREVHGDVVTIVSERDGLRILTHSEQSDYAPERERRAVSQIITAQIEAQAVDVSQLVDDDQRKRHDQFLHRIAWRTQQLRKRPPPQIAQ